MMIVFKVATSKGDSSNANPCGQPREQMHFEDGNTLHIHLNCFPAPHSFLIPFLVLLYLYILHVHVPFFGLFFIKCFIAPVHEWRWCGDFAVRMDESGTAVFFHVSIT